MKNILIIAEILAGQIRPVTYELIAAARKAIAARQWKRLEELNESLADLLFYLED